MKQGKRPTVAQMRYIENVLGLDPTEWLVARWAPGRITLVSRETSEVREFPGGRA